MVFPYIPPPSVRAKEAAAAAAAQEAAAPPPPRRGRVSDQAHEFKSHSSYERKVRRLFLIGRCARAEILGGHKAALHLRSLLAQQRDMLRFDRAADRQKRNDALIALVFSPQRLAKFALRENIVRRFWPACLRIAFARRQHSHHRSFVWPRRRADARAQRIVRASGSRDSRAAASNVAHSSVSRPQRAQCDRAHR